MSHGTAPIVGESRRWAWLKGLMGVVLCLLLLPLAFGALCYRDNEWPWKGSLR